MRLITSFVGFSLLLLVEVHVAMAEETTLYERMRELTNQEFMIDGVEDEVSGFISKPILFDVEPPLDEEEIDLSAQKEHYKMCTKRFDTGVCSLSVEIEKVAKRENRVRTLGRDLQLIAGGYELPVDDFPSHGMPLAPRLPSIVSTWQSSNDWAVTPATEHRVRVIPFPENSDLEMYFSPVEEAVTSSDQVWRYRYGLYSVRQETEEGGCQPPDGTELQETRVCSLSLESALEQLLAVIIGETEFDPPLQPGEIALFPTWAIKDRKVFIWMYTDYSAVNNDDNGPLGEIGLGFEMPLEPVLPSLSCEGDQSPSCFENAILGGVYPPDPPEPEAGEKLCSLPFSSLGYLCRPPDTLSCGTISERDCELNIVCNAVDDSYDCPDEAKTFPKIGNTVPICLPDNTSSYPIYYQLLRELEEADHRCNLPAGVSVSTNLPTCCTLEQAKAAAVCDAASEDGVFEGTDFNVSVCVEALANKECSKFIDDWDPKDLNVNEYDPSEEEVECSTIRYEPDMEEGVMICTAVESKQDMTRLYNRINSVLRNNAGGYPRSCEATLRNLGQKAKDVIDDITGGTECEDGKDNDGDGYIDYKADGSGDPECTSRKTNKEAPECSDKKDNDMDGFIDYPDDMSCSSLKDDSEFDLVLRSCYMSQSQYIAPETVSGPDVCRTGAWRLDTGFEIQHQEVEDTPEIDEEIQGPYDCGPCAVDFFCYEQCDPTPDNEDDNPPADYPLSATAPKDNNGVLHLCIPEESRLPAEYLMIHELANAQRLCALPPGEPLIEDLKSCCNIEWESNMAVCGAIEQDNAEEGVEFSVSNCAFTLTNLVCAPYSEDFQHFNDKEKIPICADDVSPAKLMEDYEKLVEAISNNEPDVETTCEGAINNPDERIKNMMSSMLYSCKPECRVEYQNTIGNNLCYIGQCVEESMELQRLLPGRMALNIPDQAFPWDAELKENPLIGAVLPTPPLPFTRLPAYRPGLLVKQLDLALCQLNGLPLQSPPQRCNFNALRQLAISPPITAFVGAGLLSQSGEQFEEAWKVQTLAQSVGTRMGNTLYSEYLNRAGKSLAELVNTANELIGGLAKIRFPDLMCPRRDG